jgi:hopanoid biosynthesis associated protein HpnK
LKHLVVTADDFGAAREVNDAIEESHRRGILTAASLMVAGPAAADAVARARHMPSLRVGLHLVLVEGRPVLAPSDIPDLVDASGNFRTDLARLGTAIFFRPNVRRQVAAEIAAQFEAFRATGLALDHVNAHKHYHLHPSIAGLILCIGKRFGMRALRVPLEPANVLAQIEPVPRDWTASLAGAFATGLRRRFRKAGVLSPDWVFGLRWSGAITPVRLAGIIANLPPGLSEIYLHPATSGGFTSAAPGYHYKEELAAITDPDIVAMLRSSAIRRGGFADFQPVGGQRRDYAADHMNHGRTLTP